MNEIDKAIEILKDKNICEFCEDCGVEKVCLACEKVSPVTADGLRTFYEITTQALQEKAEREERMQWLDDMDNPLEPIKVQSALDSEIMKYNYRKEHKPKDISVLDITIIYALNKVLEDGLKGGAE